jgi:FixJ family two-component response regulator
MSSGAAIYVVDDDASIRRSLTRLFRLQGYDVQAIASARQFLDLPLREGPTCLVLDIRMPGMTGLELQEELAGRKDPIAIVFITGHGTVPMGVHAMKAGAVDFLTKPYRSRDLLAAVRGALEKNARERSDRRDAADVGARFATLTPREAAVFELVVLGRLNKQIAGALSITERTVKVHRGRVMQKMRAGSVTDLVRFAAILARGSSSAG